MRYVFYSDNYRDRKYLEFLVKRHDFVPVVMFSGKAEYGMQKFSNEIRLDFPHYNYWHLFMDSYKWADYDYILAYYNKRYGEVETHKNIFPMVNFLFKYKDIFKKNDIIVSTNSGEWTSRAFHIIARHVGAKFFYYENFFFKDYLQLSQRPFIFSKFGRPELLDVYEYDKYDIDKIDQFLRDYLMGNDSKYEQNKSNDIDKIYDVFIPGQLPFDTNVVFQTSLYNNSWDMAKKLAAKYDGTGFVYKVHPKMAISPDKREHDHGLKNLDVVYNVSIHNIFKRVKRVYTFSSTVGIEAALRNIPVEWLSSCWYRYFNFETWKDKLKFVGACLRYAVKEEQQEKVEQILCQR